jgi:sporulation protein YlmC with PRC-barrel domain
MAIIKDSDVAGKRVIMEDASDVGTLTDIYVDTLDWRITKFDIRIEKRYAERLGREKGLLKRPVITAPIHLLKSVGDVVHLKGGIDDLAKTQKAILPPSEIRRAKEAGEPLPAKAAKAAKADEAGKASKAEAKAPPGDKPAPPADKPPKKEEKKEKPRSL